MFFNSLGRSGSFLLLVLGSLLAAPALAQQSGEGPILLAMQQRTGEQLLEQGLEQYRRGEYQQAYETLRQIRFEDLSERDREILADTLARAEAAMQEQPEPRVEVEPMEPVDVDVDVEAEPQVEAPRPPRAPLNAREAYVLGRDQYRAGDWEAARRNLELASRLGYRPRLFETSAEDYLGMMDAREREMAMRAQEEQERAAREAEEEARRQEEARIRAEREAELLAQQEAEEQARREAELLAQREEEERLRLEREAEAMREEVAERPPAEEPAVEPEVADIPPTPEAELERTVQLERIAREEQVAEARELVVEAREAQARRDFATALDLYSQALERDPGNLEAQAGRDEMLVATGRVVDPPPLLRDQEAQIQIRRERVIFQFNQSISEMRESLAVGDFARARRALESARLARDSDPMIFTREEMAEFNAIVREAEAAMDRTLAEWERREAEERLREAEAELHRRLAEEERMRRRTIADLIRNSRIQIEQGRYREALGVIDQILILEPTNDYAVGVRPLVEDRAMLQEQRMYREEFDRRFAKSMNLAEEKKIPYDEIMVYPANWPDISEMRDATAAAERGAGGDDAVVRQVLDRRLPEVRFEAARFGDVIDFFRDVTGANIFVNWSRLQEAGIDQNTPVTARLRDVRFERALTVVLADAGGGAAWAGVTLGYTIDEGVITISTDEDLARNVLVQVYDIRDLIIDVPNFVPPVGGLGGGGLGGGGGGFGGGGGGFGGGGLGGGGGFGGGGFGGGGGGFGGGGGGFGGGGFGGGGGLGQQQDIGRTREEIIEEITDLIMETIAPDSWRDFGGTVGALRVQGGGQLIVTQTPENQRLVFNLLEQLREVRAIQVTVETRFLTVQRNFLEDVGLDLDFVFNIDRPQSRWSTIPVRAIRHTDGFTVSPDTGLPGSIGREDPLGFQASASFLDDFQVNMLLRATMASQHSTLLTAPRVTLYNGQRGYVIVSLLRAYISDLRPVVGQAAVGFDPEIGIVPSGVVLDVQATVSADRKYVTLTLRPQLITLINLFEIRFLGGVAGGVGVTPGLPGTEPIGITSVIQQPEIQITEVATTVTVPDGGTLLLGGQTLAGEVERELGTPILSKIPFLKRLFTNRSLAKDEQVLLILVKPTIIIQREQEARQFPLLTTRVGG